MHSEQMVSAQELNGPVHYAVAPAWHTAVILIVLFLMSLSGAYIWPTGLHRHAGEYLLIIILECAMAAFIWHGTSRRGVPMADLVGGRWARPMHVVRDIGIAIGFLVASAVVLQGLGYLIKASNSNRLTDFLPRGPGEVVLWVVMSLCAGFCEELIFRGYLQRQFAALTQATTGGIILQGVVFGASHGYQGWKLMLIISVFGSMFGLLAHWRRSLRPGMIAHFLQDGVVGTVASYLLR